MQARTSVGLFAAVTAIALGAAACQNPAVQRELEELRSVSAEKDSLLREVVANTQLMSDISAELAKVRDPRGPAMRISGESPIASYRDSLLERIREVTERVNESEGRLQAAQRRIRTLTTSSDSLRAQVARYDSLITDFQTVIDNQRTTIASLTTQVNQLQEENTRLTVRNVALTDTVTTLKEKDKRAYYVVGTKKELIEWGIVREEGGARFLFIFGKRGETLVPARELSDSAFTVIDRWNTTEIPFPRTDKAYRIVSRQNVEALAEAPDDGKLRGSLRIANPEAFWLPSRFLIIVES